MRAPAQKQKDNASGYDRAPRATVLHEANVYLAADADSQKVSLVTPGHEVVTTEHSGPWVKVFANTDTKDDAEDKPEFTEDENVQPVSGWIREWGWGPGDPTAGHPIVFGAAAGA